MHSAAQRWFDPNQTANLVSSMAKTCLRAAPVNLDGQSENRDSKRLHVTLVAMGASLVFLVLLQVVLECFAERLPGKEPNYPALAMIWLVVLGGSGLLTFFISGRNNKQRGKRDLGFAALAASNPTLRVVDRLELPEHLVGRTPWFMSEEFSTLNGIACGQYQGTDLCLIEGGQIVDPVLATTDSQLAAGAMSLINNKQKRMYKNDFDAIVFLQPLPSVPDLVIVTKRDPNRGYFKRALVKQGCQVELKTTSRKFRSNYWVGSADPDACLTWLTPELEALLDKLPKGIVQVTGGFCTVIPAQWNTMFPGQAPKSETELTQNMGTAIAVYKTLAGRSAGPSIPQTAYAPVQTFGAAGHQGGVAMMAAPTQAAAGYDHNVLSDDLPKVSEQTSDAANSSAIVASPAAPRQAERSKRVRHGWFMLLILFGIGLPMLMLGAGMSFVATLDRKNAEACRAWPTTNGFITKSVVETKNGFHKPIIEYKYRVDGKNFDADRVRFGWNRLIEDRKEAGQLQQKFPRGQKTVVYYNGDNPNLSALEPGLQDPNVNLTFRNVGFAFLFLGLLFCGKGLRGKRRRESSESINCRPSAGPTSVK